MSESTFGRWNEATAAEHNRRVANRKAVAKTVVSAAAIVAGTRVRQSHKQPSKIHRDWGDYLRRLEWPVHIHEEAINLRLCNGVNYRPDWIAVHRSGAVTAFECKGGFMYDDARKSLLFAAKTYPWIRFMLVWRQNGQWQQQQILGE